MSTPIFNHAANSFQGAWANDSVFVTLSDGVPSLLLQNISAQFQQSIRTLYALNTASVKNAMYKVGGRAEGRGSIGRFIGEAALMATFYAKFGDICNMASNSLSISTASARCDTGGSSSVGGAINAANAPAAAGVGTFAYTMLNCILSGISINQAIDPILVQESSSIEFANMTIG